MPELKVLPTAESIEAIESFVSRNPHMHRKGAKLIRLCRKCVKKAKKYYKDGEIIPFDREKLIAADALPENTPAEKRARKSAVHKAIREKHIMKERQWYILMLTDSSSSVRITKIMVKLPDSILLLESVQTKRDAAKWKR